jgi:hypothetical protein
MLVRDPYSGFLHEVDEGPDLSEYDMGEVVYDGLGNPVGVLPALIPLITSALPALAKTALPALTSLIPKITGMMSNLGPGPDAPMSPTSGPLPMPGAPMLPRPPGAPGPMMMLRRRPRRRRLYAR